MLKEGAMVTALLQWGPERACWGGGVTIINGSPAMLMVRRTIGFILCHMLPMAAQTGPVSTGAPLFGLAHNHHGTHASQGHGSCVCVHAQACECARTSILKRVFNSLLYRTCRPGNWHPIDAAQGGLFSFPGAHQSNGERCRCSPELLVCLSKWACVGLIFFFFFLCICAVCSINTCQERIKKYKKAEGSFSLV